MALLPPDVRAFQASLPPLEADWSERANKRAVLEANARNQDAMARANAAEAAQREQAMAEADAMQRIAVESKGDWDVMIERATALNPTLGATLTKQRGDAQQATAKAVTEQLTAEKQRTERGRMFLEVAKNDPEFYNSMVGSIAAMLPEELGAALPRQHDPARIAALLDATADATKRMERAGQLHDKVLSGEAFKGVLGQLAEQDTEEEYNGVINTYAAFLPKGTLALLPKWGPDAQAKAAAMAMTPAEKADDARAEAAAAATATKDARDFTALERHRRATEGHAAATERRLSTQAAGGGTGGGALPPRVETTVRGLSTAFRNEAAVKRAVTMGEAVSFVNSLDKNTTSPADDQALIYAFAKAMDPESVVREGEYATVAKYAQSWLSRFGFDAMRVLSSNAPILTPHARDNLKKTITTRFSASRGTYDNLVKSYVSQINKATGADDGMDRLTDYGAVFPGGSSGAAPATGTPTKKINPFRK